MPHCVFLCLRIEEQELNRQPINKGLQLDPLLCIEQIYKLRQDTCIGKSYQDLFTVNWCIPLNWACFLGITNCDNEICLHNHRKVQALNGRWFLTVNQSKWYTNVSFKVKLLLQFLLKVKIKKIFAITWGSLDVEGTAKISYTHMDSDKQKKRQCCDLNWYHILHLKACDVYDGDDNALGLIIFSRAPMWEPSDRQWRKPSYL